MTVDLYAGSTYNKNSRLYENKYFAGINSLSTRGVYSLIDTAILAKLFRRKQATHYACLCLQILFMYR